MENVRKVLVRKKQLPKALLQKFNTHFASGIPAYLRKTIALGKAQKAVVVEWKTEGVSYLVILDRPAQKQWVRNENSNRALQFLLEDKEQGEAFAQVREWQDSIQGENIAEDC